MVSLKPHVIKYCEKELSRLGFSTEEISKMGDNIRVDICIEFGGKGGRELRSEIIEKYSTREDFNFG